MRMFPRLRRWWQGNDKPVWHVGSPEQNLGQYFTSKGWEEAQEIAKEAKNQSCRYGRHGELRSRGAPWAECVQCGKMIDVGYSWRDPLRYTANDKCNCMMFSTAGRHDSNCGVYRP